MTQGIFEVKSFPKIFDSMGVRMVLQSQAPKRILWLGGSGPHKINPPSIHFIGGSESVLCMWQLVFASCHRLISKNKNKKNKKCQKGA